MMPDARELHREDSSVRAIFGVLDQFGPLTQLQIAARADITISCACKGLKFLREEGYVQRMKQTYNRKGSSIGKLPYLYGRTIKSMPDVPRSLPEPPSARELCEIMNAIIRRKSS